MIQIVDCKSEWQAEQVDGARKRERERERERETEKEWECLQAENKTGADVINKY